MCTLTINLCQADLQEGLFQVCILSPHLCTRYPANKKSHAKEKFWLWPKVPSPRDSKVWCQSLCECLKWELCTQAAAAPPRQWPPGWWTGSLMDGCSRFHLDSSSSTFSNFTSGTTIEDDLFLSFSYQTTMKKKMCLSVWILLPSPSNTYFFYSSELIHVFPRDASSPASLPGGQIQADSNKPDLSEQDAARACHCTHISDIGYMCVISTHAAVKCCCRKLVLHVRTSKQLLTKVYTRQATFANFTSQSQIMQQLLWP